MARVIKVGEDAFGSDFTPIPVGSKLKVSVFDIKEGVTGPNSQNPGSPQFVFTAKVTEEGEFAGREIRYNYISLDPKAKGAWALVAFAESVGWPTSKENGVELPDDLTEVLGTEFIAKIGQTTGQDGNTYNRVTGYAPLRKGGVPATPPAEKAAKSWTEL